MKVIRLTNGMEAFVDDEDYPLVSRHVWHADRHRNTYYAKSNSARGYMHHIVFGTRRKGCGIDHRDLNGLNNTKANLREASPSENQRNRRASGRSKYLGVSWHPQARRWRATITVEGCRKHLGFFVTEEDAARAYDKEALVSHGLFARPNFPPEEGTRVGSN